MSLHAQMRRGHGLQVNVDTNWVNGPGYYPVRITVTPLARPARDRRLRLEFEPLTDGARSSTAVAACDVVVPASGGSVSTTLSVAKLAPWYAFNLRVFEFGQGDLKKLAFENQTLSSQQLGTSAWGFGWNEDYPGILVVGDKSPDAIHLIEALTQRVAGAGFQFQAAGGGNSPTISLPHLPMERLPERWINYSALDVVCLSMDKLAKLVDEHPQRASAMRSWVAAGGNLWVYGLEDDFSKIDSLERLIDLPLPAAPAARKTGDAPAGAQDLAKTRLEVLARRGWMAPGRGSIAGRFNRADGRRNSRSSADDPSNSSEKADPEEDEANEQSPTKPESDAPSDDVPRFLHHPLQLGRVTAFSSDDPFSQPADHWRRLLDADQTRLQWDQRHGLNLMGGNADFIKFLIPGVGEVPVTMFNVLITLFVVIIGPLNYWTLRRRRRLHLLIVTTPLCAGVATVSLVVYALVADGFSIRVQARSYTQIDQRRGEAVSWTRLSYYVGLAPSGGLVFADDTLVLPLFQSRSRNSGGGGPAKYTFWDQFQRLERGWLRSRTPTQFLTVQARTTESRLIVRDVRPGVPSEVENRLGTRIDHLLLVDSEGKVFEGSAIDPDKVAALESRDAATALATLQQRLRLHRLFVPAGMLAAGASAFGGGGMFGRFRGSTGDQATGLLETSLQRLESMRPIELEPRSYIAVVERSPQLEFGLERIDEEQGFHVVVGRW